jgi:midasin (ATPase involved in ribosome maturation)
MSLNHMIYNKIEINDNNNDNNKFLYFPHLTSIKQQITSLFKVNNSLLKFVFYGPKSSGKTTLSKIILNNPLIIEVDESIETNFLLGGYLINEFSEIIWQDGILLSALKSNRDILFLSIEKCGNDLLSILKQILERNSIFIPAKQEHLSNFSSRIIMIYNTPNENTTTFSPNLNFIFSNAHTFNFQAYSFDNIISICEYMYNLLPIEKEILMKLISTYISIPSKVKVNSRFRKLTLSNIISFCKQYHSFFINNDINNNVSFISEKLQMKIVTMFIYENLLSLDSDIQLQSICDIFSTEFNFNSKDLHNEIFNLNDKFTFASSEYNYIETFTNEKIHFNSIPKGNFYSYNTLSKFSLK